MVLALASILSILIVPAEAATTSTTITSGKTYYLKTNYRYDSDNNRIKNKTYYKLTLSDDSVVKVYWTRNNANKASIDIYSNSARNKTVRYVSTTDKTSGSEYLALAKGTYYLNMYDGYTNYEYTATTRVTFTVTPVSEINKDNYCKSKAIYLKSDKWVTIAQTPNNSYARWYKMYLSSEQVVKIYTNASNAYSVSLYTSKLDRVDCESSSSLVKSKNKLASGYYYIYVQESTYFSGQGRLGDYIRLKWK